jgi:hypothetical protein
VTPVAVGPQDPPLVPDETKAPTSGDASAPQAPASNEPAKAVQLGPVVPHARPPQGEIEDDEADPLEVRRRIAAASRSFDPDDQVRRAMDAFFSPTLPEPERSIPPEH